MQKIKGVAFLILEAVVYGFFISICVLIVLSIEDFLMKIPCTPDFSCGYGERGIPVGGVFIGAILSAIFWNLLFGKIIKSVSVRWFLILITSSITAISLQTIYFILVSDMTVEQVIAAYLPERVSELLGLKLMFKLFIILTPFTVLFTNRHLLIERVKSRSSLK